MIGWACALALVAGARVAAGAEADAGGVGAALEACRADVVKVEARVKREMAERKRLEAEVARLEEALEEARRRTDYARVATSMAKEASDRAKKLAKEAKPLLERAARDAKPLLERAAREAKPLLERAAREAKPTLARAGKSAKIAYEKEIRRMKKVWSPLRRNLKAKMRRNEHLKAYATDDNIEYAFQMGYTLFLAWAVMRVVGVINRLAFRRRAVQRVPRHVRAKSVELRPLSPDPR